MANVVEPRWVEFRTGDTHILVNISQVVAAIPYEENQVALLFLSGNKYTVRESYSTIKKMLKGQ